MMSYMEAMKKRTSVRAYRPEALKKEDAGALKALCRESSVGPFGNRVRLKFLELAALSREDLKGLGTYGIIRGARQYILAAVQEGEGAQEDVGFCLEKVILGATVLGLSTCWLAGTFRRSNFARRMQLAKGEFLPAITPVGYGASKPGLVYRALGLGLRARRRKPWAELFFQADGTTPLPPEEAGPYRKVLEAVRLGPSATNRQPWRLFKHARGFSLYLAENPRYNSILGKVKPQNMDMGIAMCHFQLAAAELGLAGRWQPPGPGSMEQENGPGLRWIADWITGYPGLQN